MLHKIPVFQNGKTVALALSSRFSSPPHKLLQRATRKNYATHYLEAPREKTLKFAWDLHFFQTEERRLSEWCRSLEGEA